MLSFPVSLNAGIPTTGISSDFLTTYHVAGLLPVILNLSSDPRHFILRDFLVTRPDRVSFLFLQQRPASPIFRQQPTPTSYVAADHPTRSGDPRRLCVYFMTRPDPVDSFSTATHIASSTSISDPRRLSSFFRRLEHPNLATYCYCQT